METENIHVSSTQKAPASVFLSATIVIFVLTLSAADSVGFVPNYMDGTNSKVALSNLPQLGEENDSIPVVAGVLPERIVISAISMDLPIQNPATKNIDALTEVLKSGPARYVDSAKLGEKGNTLLFGHSSQLPIVRNQMYKAFNNISKLKAGDTITVFGGGNEYLYNVVSVRAGDAKEDVIDLSQTEGARITLVTCNTLGEKSARWIVEAEFIGSLPSGN
ncbi:MAG: sortase [bacterium]|nr:sortase [bacterium]